MEDYDPHPLPLFFREIPTCVDEPHLVGKALEQYLVKVKSTDPDKCAKFSQE
jgi:hypothetical protein